MNILGKGIKQLSNLISLKLDLSFNYIGKNLLDFKYLGEGLKKLINLKIFELDL